MESFREPSATPQVLFLSRLHARKRPLMFIEAAALVAPRIPAAKFVLVGPDGGEAKRCLSRIAALGVEDSVSWQGPARDFELTGVLDASAIYVHSARDEPFGLTIIEALARGVPVVVTESAALAPILRKWRAGTVVGDSAAAIASGVSELLQDPALAQSQVRNGLALVTDRFSGDAQRALLLSHYQQRASPLV
nr:glycosyltransferase family 4 protein [Demequina sp. NBRC 110056]